MDPDPNDGTEVFCPDEDSWARLMSELGGSMIPNSLAPARTLGYGGFYMGIDTWITGVDGNSRHWSLGTEGDDGAGTETCADFDTGLGCNRFAPSALFWTRAQLRKGFPFGFELGTSFSYLWNSQLFAWGLEIRWAIIEGWDFPVPDVAVRGQVNTLVGDAEFNMTVPSIDVVVSERIAISRSAVLTPFVAGQVAFIFADSELIDFTPGTDAYAECRSVADADMASCSVGGADFANNSTFDEIRAARWRLTLGAQGQYEWITVSAAFAFDLVKPGADDDIPDDVNRQWTVNFGAGATF